MNWKFWQPNNATLKEPEWWRQQMQQNRSVSGTYITETAAFNIVSVNACVRILSETIASLPLVVYQREPDGSKKEATQHPLYSLFKYGPNADQTPMQMLEQQMVALTLRGNAYAQVIRDGGNRVNQIVPLKAEAVSVSDDGKRFVYSPEKGTPREFSKDSIWRIAGLTSDGFLGFSPISLLRDPAGISYDLQESQGAMIRNGLMPSGVFEFPGKIDEKHFENVKERLRDMKGSANRGEPLILQSGMQYKGLSISPQDAQLLESRKFQIAEIARVFRVPLHMLGELDKATFSNIEHQSLEFVIHTIRPWCERIEQTITRDLIGKPGQSKYFAEFNLDALLRGDLSSRYTAYGMAIKDGWMSRNEARTKENMNPADGLDDFMTPLNMAMEGRTDERDSDL
jgi:HK97 family phage portal protein